MWPEDDRDVDTSYRDCDASLLTAAVALMQSGDKGVLTAATEIVLDC